MTAVVKLTYLDTSALMRRAEGQADDCSPRNALITPFIRDIFADADRVLAMSELTLIEFHSNVTTHWRSSAYPNCNRVWWQESLDQMLDLIADHRLLVLGMPPKAIEQVMSLVTVATRDYGRGLRAWDALHYVVASQWAWDRADRVDLVTSDSDFSATVDLVRGSGMVEVVNLDVLAGTGEGADRGN